MKLKLFFQKTPIILAAENNNEEMVKVLLENQNIDVNFIGILISIFLSCFKYKKINTISN